MMDELDEETDETHEKVTGSYLGQDKLQIRGGISGPWAQLVSGNKAFPVIISCLRWALVEGTRHSWNSYQKIALKDFFNFALRVSFK